MRTRISLPITAVFSVFVVALLVGCGGSSGSSDSDAELPGVPLDVTVNAGDTAISVGWRPPADSGGAAIQEYRIEVTPAVDAANIQVSGASAIIGNLTNGSDYQVTVAARNSKGTGPASTAVTAQPAAADKATYTEVSISGDPGSPSGIYDPSLLRSATGDLWMSYTSVDYYNNGSGQLVQDAGIRVARSVDNGVSFNYVETIAEPSGTTILDSDPARSACGFTTCIGRWVYETSWLVEDASDPDPDRRFKLFAHKYFLYPPATGSATLYHLGAIVMWTASSPDSQWSDETVLFGWPSTTPNLSPLIDVTSLSPELADCLVVAEGGATINGSDLDMVFACPYDDALAGAIVQKIVLLRSSDHAASFEYVSTLLTLGDVPLDIDYFSAPALIANDDAAPVLLVTPVVNGIYAGSLVYPFADEARNTLMQVNGVAQAIAYIPVKEDSNFGGASSYARNTGTLGVLQSDAAPAPSLLDVRFTILATHAMVEQ